MKKFKVITAVVMGLGLVLFAVQCQHKDQEVIPIVGPDPIVHGTEKISCTDCNTAPAAGSGLWYHDKAHSNVSWETQYKEGGSLLTGRFDSFFMTNMDFDEAVPANITFEGYVYLNTVNTGEPCRDKNCLLTSFGTSGGNLYDRTLAVEGCNIPKNVLPDDNIPTNKAILKAKAGTGRYSTSDAGFLIDADFTFLGITKTVTVKQFFAAKFGAGPFTAGFNSEFTINKADFLPNDSNIGDVITIKINSTMKTK